LADFAEAAVLRPVLRGALAGVAARRLAGRFSLRIAINSF